MNANPFRPTCVDCCTPQNPWTRIFLGQTLQGPVGVAFGVLIGWWMAAIYGGLMLAVLVLGVRWEVRKLRAHDGSGVPT